MKYLTLILILCSTAFGGVNYDRDYFPHSDDVRQYRLLTGGFGDMFKSTYDVLNDGFVDGNDTAFGATWNGNINAPSMNAVYDEFIALLGDFLAIDGSNANVTIDIGSEDLTTTGDIRASDFIPSDGGTVGQAAGPLLTYDDTNDVMILTGGRFIINRSVPTGGFGTSNFVMAGSGPSASGILAIDTGPSMGGSGGSVQLFVDDGAVMVINHRLGYVAAGGSTGAGASNLRNGAGIDFFADGTWVQDVSHPSRIELRTTDVNESSRFDGTSRLTIKRDGKVGINEETPAAKLEVNGTFRAGDGGSNRFNTDASGQVTLVGNARVIDHLHFTMELGRGQNAPTVRYTEDPYVSYTFGIGDDSHMTREISTDMDYTADSIIKVHWYTTDATADGVDEVRWEVQWASRAIGEDITAGDTTDNSGDIVCSAENIIVETTVETVVGNSIAEGDQFGLHLQRIALGDGTGPTAGTIHVVDVELHYISNKLGEAI